MPSNAAEARALLALDAAQVALAERALERLAQAGASPQRAVVLECGTGAAALNLAAAGLATLGLDDDAESLEVARTRATAAGIALELARTDALPAAFVGCCDLALLGRGLEQLLHTYELLPLLALAARLLRPGGLVCGMHTPAAALRAEAQPTTLLRDDADCLAWSSAEYLPEHDRRQRRVVWFQRNAEHWRRGELAWQERPWETAELQAAFTETGFSFFELRIEN